MPVPFGLSYGSIASLALWVGAVPGTDRQQEKHANPPTSPTGGVSSAAAEKPRDRVPAWTADARWYYVVIPRFCNGDPQNDPAEAISWSTDWPTVAGDAGPDATDQTKLEIDIKDRRYGGDLSGLIKRLPYLKELGINALCLSPVFHGAGELRLPQVDLRHVDPWIGVKSGADEVPGEKSDPGTWQWTSSDKMLLDLILRAHEQGIRVVISGIFHAVSSGNAPPAELEAYYLAATRRWMDPDGDGNPADGVDGWHLSLEEGALRPFGARETAFWDRWREAVRRTNPGAVVIGSGPLALAGIAKGPFDIALNESLTRAIQYFFSPANPSAAIKELFDAIDSARPPSLPATRAGHLTLASSAGRAPRLLSALTERDRSLLRGRNASPGLLPDDDARARWRLATIFQHFCIGAPATYYGDEVGMYGGSGAFVSPPMWWKDGSESAARSTHHRDDFFALVQWLHHMREWYEPLRRGDFRRVLADDENKVLAFARTLPGDEIILVMNYGASKQKVMLPAGKPGQLIAVFSPQVQPSEKGSPLKPKAPEAAADTKKIEPLGVGGSRQFVNPEGKIRIWVAPMSVRVVFVNDKEPRR
ncbi:MAG: alpha-amylase family glycosyl hydrolase [Phycisphaerales bacterium]|nr:alpha-amylase family glycosyl hydrolase [Phycisphaerales bacterium]